MRPAELIDQAFLQLEFAIKLMVYFELRRIDKDEFDSDLTVLLTRRNLGFPSGSFSTYDDLILAAQNNAGLVTLAFTVFALDEALHPGGKGRGADDLSKVVYSMRNAFAHPNLLAPEWNVDPRYRSVTTVVGVQVDLGSLHKQPFDIEHVGGYEGYFAIKDEVRRRVI